MSNGRNGNAAPSDLIPGPCSVGSWERNSLVVCTTILLGIWVAFLQVCQQYRCAGPRGGAAADRAVLFLGHRDGLRAHEPADHADPRRPLAALLAGHVRDRPVRARVHRLPQGPVRAGEMRPAVALPAAAARESVPVATRTAEDAVWCATFTPNAALSSVLPNPRTLHKTWLLPPRLTLSSPPP